MSSDWSVPGTSPAELLRSEGRGAEGFGGAADWLRPRGGRGAFKGAERRVRGRGGAEVRGCPGPGLGRAEGARGARPRGTAALAQGGAPDPGPSQRCPCPLAAGSSPGELILIQADEWRRQTTSNSKVKAMWQVRTRGWAPAAGAVRRWRLRERF